MSVALRHAESPLAVSETQGMPASLGNRHAYTLVAVVALLTSLGLAGFYQVSRTNDERRFRNATEIVQDAIAVRVETYISALLATRSLFTTRGADMDAEAFRVFVAGLAIGERYPGIQGIGFSQSVPHAEVAKVEARLAREHDRPFRIWPVAPREELHSIVYLEPLDRRNLAALGFDMFSEPTRREAMARARDTGLPAASGRVTLVQEIDKAKQPGFLIYVPLYAGGDPGDVAGRRAALLGFVYSPFRMGDLMRGIFGTQREPRVEFDVYDGATIGQDNLLFSGITQPARGSLRDRVPLTVAGRTWTMELQSTPALATASSARFMPYLLVVGVAGVLGVLLLTYAQVRARNEERQARHQAEQAVRVRDDFLAVAGHELKTPLAALQLQVEGLRRQSQKNDFVAEPARLGARLAKAEMLVRRLEILIGNLLDVSRITTGRLAVELDNVELGGLLADVLERFDESLKRAGCEVRLDVPEPVTGRWDRARLDQVFTNLISNAQKYGAGKPVEVIAVRRGDNACVSVRDHGIGIDPDDIGRIFGRFERAVSVRHYGGLGLGLWISQQMVRALGGRIELASEVGRGTIFTVHLPLHAQARSEVR